MALGHHTVYRKGKLAIWHNRIDERLNLYFPQSKLCEMVPGNSRDDLLPPFICFFIANEIFPDFVNVVDLADWLWQVILPAHGADELV
jgi:hypothetical protein